MAKIESRKQATNPPYLGISSFLIAIFTLIIFSLGIYMLLSRYHNESYRWIIGICIISSFVLSIIGFIIGKVATKKNESKKVFKVMGITINLIFLILFSLVFILPVFLRIHGVH